MAKWTKARCVVCGSYTSCKVTETGYQQVCPSCRRAHPEKAEKARKYNLAIGLFLAFGIPLLASINKCTTSNEQPPEYTMQGDLSQIQSSNFLKSPDILGIRLGSSIESIQKSFDNSWSVVDMAESGSSRDGFVIVKNTPYDTKKNQSSDVLTAFYDKNQKNIGVTGIIRYIYFIGDYNNSKDKIITEVIKKYGTPSFESEYHNYYAASWVYDKEGELIENDKASRSETKSHIYSCIAHAENLTIDPNSIFDHDAYTKLDNSEYNITQKLYSKSGVDSYRLTNGISFIYPELPSGVVLNSDTMMPLTDCGYSIDFKIFKEQEQVNLYIIATNHRYNQLKIELSKNKEKSQLKDNIENVKF